MADLGSALASMLQVPGLQELLNQSITQQRQLQPLKTAVNQLAINMLPNSAFPGQSASGLGTRQNLADIPPANFTTPKPSGPDWSTILPLIAAGLAGAAKASGGSGSGGKLPIQNLIDALRNRFGKQPSVLGNRNSVPNLPYQAPNPWSGINWGNLGTTENGVPMDPTQIGYQTGPDPLPPLTPNVTTDETFTYPGYPSPQGYDSTNPSGDPYGGGGTFSTEPF